MANMPMSQLKKDLDKILEHPLEGILCFPKDDTLTTLIIVVKKNDGYLFELGVHKNYPRSQPAIRMLCGYNHAKTTKEGLICLKAPKSGKWTLEHVMKSMHDLFVKCNNKIISGDGRQSLQPDQEENIRHSGFYYAIRSGKTAFLNSLIQQWPGNMFDSELDKVLSRAYAELKLKNVKISLEMDIIVQNKLLNFRLCSTVRQNTQNEGNIFKNTLEEVQLLLENIALLKAEYFDSKKVDDKFVFIATFIVRIIHTLKRQLKSTYNKLPWEEVEFCLTSFVACHIKQQEINLYCRAFLNKSKVLNTLDNFGKRLNDELKNSDSLNTRKRIDTLFLPNLTREEVVANIIHDCPEFSDLYSDYEQIRDIHSLMVIRDNIELALSADPNQKEGQKIIMRAIQVIGENLKNTLESPKLSNTTSDLLLLTLPKNTRKIFTVLRNSLSHANAMANTTEFEQSNVAAFFVGVQKDVHRISKTIFEILYKYKLKIIKILLEKIINAQLPHEITEMAEYFTHDDIYLFSITNESKKTNKINETEQEKVGRLTKEMSEIIINKTVREQNLFTKISNILDCEKAAWEDIWASYIKGMASLRSICTLLSSYEIDNNGIRNMKFMASNMLKNFLSQNKRTRNLKEIAHLSLEIAESAATRACTTDTKLDMISNITFEIFCVTQFGTGNLKWIEELKEKLNLRGSLISGTVSKMSSKLKMHNDQLAIKLSDLKHTLETHGLGTTSFNKLSFYLADKKLQALVEMLLLDILSISNATELSTNPCFLYDQLPILTGKHLRDHLAHGNTLIDILPVDPSIAIILNALSLTKAKYNEISNKTIKLDLENFRETYRKSLITITNQESMFAALKKGNREEFKCCLSKGADINGIRRIDAVTSLHFAAAGHNVEAVSFLLAHNIDITTKDANGQNPIHVAAAHGSTIVLDFFMKSCNAPLNDLDYQGDSPLHIAAKSGHTDAVIVLLRNNADINKKNSAGYAPLHVAILNKRTAVSKLLLEKDLNVDANEATGGYSALLVAAEKGCLDLVEFLLNRKANVNTRQHKGATPLHLASLNGHVDVVKTLILRGADVNARVLDGCSPLHYGTENGHEEIVNILMKHGANANVIDETYKNTPLHYACKDGHEKIVRVLLKNKANGNVVTSNGMTPLHFAAKSGHLKIVVALLEYGVNICANDENNSKPLHYAAEYGHKEVAEIFINSGVDSNVMNVFGETPLHLAAAQKDPHIIELLLRNKADVKAKDCMGYGPLYVAVANSGDIKIIELLIKQKALVNEKNYEGATPLHAAALNGNDEAVAYLLKSGAEVNAQDALGVTPLHGAIKGGYKGIVKILLEHKPDVNAESLEGTPVETAVRFGRKDILEILLVNGAHVKSSSLPLAIELNNKDIVQLLVENGAPVDGKSGEPLSVAVLSGRREIVELLLKHNAKINGVASDGKTPLHIAAYRGHKEILNALIKGGAYINAVTVDAKTPLYCAAEKGHEDIAAVLIANKADMNIMSKVLGVPLHAAARGGHASVVNVLLANGAKSNLKNNMGRTPLELAVGCGHLPVVKIFLKYDQRNVSSKYDEGWTLLHIASQEDNVEIINFLVNAGADVHAKTDIGSKPIHIAARKGCKETVKHFITASSLTVNEISATHQTLLHCAVMGGHLNTVEYLISKGAAVNAIDDDKAMPIHLAASFGCENVVKILLEHGAVFNSVEKRSLTPLQLATNERIISLLEETEKLVLSVKRKDPAAVDLCIRNGASVNAQDVHSLTPLHYAAWKGFDDVVKILLERKANPNALVRKGMAAIHYAANFANFNTVKTLLSYGAIYNIVSENDIKPSDYAFDSNISRLFKLLDELFKKVKEANIEVIKDLEEIKDLSVLKAVMNARNKENRTLIVVATLCKFPYVEQLKMIAQGNVSSQIFAASQLFDQGHYEKSLKTYSTVFEKRKGLLGADNPGTLDIETNIAQALYKQGKYQEALKKYEEILHKQTKMLGADSNDALNTRSLIALVLHRQDKSEMAWQMFLEVYEKQNLLLGPDDPDTLRTQFHLALVLEKLGKHEEALNINKIIYEKRKRILGPYDSATVSAQNNIAMVLASLKKYDQSLTIYKEVLEKKTRLLGVNHTDTLRTMHSIGNVLERQGKQAEALTAYEQVLGLQKKVLGENHPETWNTQLNIATSILNQGKMLKSFKLFSEIYQQGVKLFGVNNPRVMFISQNISAIEEVLKLQGSDLSEVSRHLQSGIINAANNGNIQSVQDMLENGADVNGTDDDGRTPLHFAISNNHMEAVNVLLKNGADVSKATKKGNTPLHTATSKGYKDIIDVLFEHISNEKLSDYINAKTSSSGATALHVAVKNSFIEIVMSLLKYGATYNITNNDGQKPIDIAKDVKINILLKAIDDLFKYVANGDDNAIKKLQTVKPEEFLAFSNARNLKGNTLLQVAIANGHKSIARKVLELMKR